MRAMKDSGIEWIGEIPDEWRVCSARNVFSEVKTKNTDGQETCALQFKFGAIIRKTNFNADDDNYVAETITNYTVVGPRTIMVNGLNLNYDFKTQRVAIVKEKGVITSAYLALCPDEQLINAEFATYLLKGYESKMAFHNMGTGIRLTLGFREFKEQPILLPPPAEQQRIAAYLDEQCGEIDRVLAKTRESIEEYKKLKQSVITEAVTKGIRPDRPMKPSGIEWIGDIPAEWEVCRLGKIYSEYSETGNDDLPILTVSINSGISDKELTDDENVRKFVRSEDKSKYKSVQPNDLVYNMMRAWQGAIGAVKVNGMVSPAYVVLKPRGEICSPYVECLLRSPMGVEEIRRYSYGIADFRQRLYWDAGRNLRISVPPFEEQKEIMVYLDQQCSEIDRLIAKKEQIITELEGYKKSLIYECVTGKREVAG